MAGPTLWEIERWLAQGRGYGLGLELRDGKFGAVVVKVGDEFVGSRVVARGQSRSLDQAVGQALEDLRQAERLAPPPVVTPPGFTKVTHGSRFQVTAPPAKSVTVTLPKPAGLPPPQNYSKTSCTGCRGGSGQSPSANCPCGCGHYFCATCVSFVNSYRARLAVCDNNCGEHYASRALAGSKCGRGCGGTVAVRP